MSPPTLALKHIRQRTGLFVIGQMPGGDGLFGNQHGDAGALRIVILVGDIENIGADNVGDVGQNLRQALSIVGVVNIFDIVAPRRGRLGVANIVYVKAQRFGEIIEAMQLQLL